MNVYDNQKWCVHVMSADSVLAAKDFTEAVEQCDRINRNIVKMQPEFDNEHYPIIWAKVEIWEDVASGPHRPERTNWDEVC